MTYAHDDAIEFLKDANREYNKMSYALAAYLANIAKSSFKICGNPVGVKECDDLIGLVAYAMKGMAMVRLVKRSIVPTPDSVFRETIKSKEFDDLEALTLSARVA